jgi:cytoskeletal protein CcmA (bactofilin family)
MTHIGPSVVFEGDLTSEEDITIAGRLIGDLYARNATLVVAQSGRLESVVHAARVVVHGTVEGAITASERIELTPSAQVTGDLSATHVVVADGATFHGSIDMGRRTIAAKVAQYKAGVNDPSAGAR